MGVLLPTYGHFFNYDAKKNKRPFFSLKMLHFHHQHASWHGVKGRETKIDTLFLVKGFFPLKIFFGMSCISWARNLHKKKCAVWRCTTSHFWSWRAFIIFWSGMDTIKFCSELPTFKKWLESSLVHYLAHDFLDSPCQQEAFWADSAPFGDVGRLVVIHGNFRGTRL